MNVSALDQFCPGKRVLDAFGLTLQDQPVNEDLTGNRVVGPDDARQRAPVQDCDPVREPFQFVQIV